MADIYERLTKNRHFELALRIVTVLILLYLFLIGVKSLSTGLKMMGGGFAETLFNLTSQPFISLMAGMLATVLFQSSSVTTSIIVGLVGAGTLSIGNAVPMIMGANLGTSVTNSIVSLGYCKNMVNFKRAFAAATVHDFFNILSVAILLPLELMTGVIEKSASAFATFLYGSTAGLKFSSPIKAAIKPPVKFLKANSTEFFGSSASIIMLILAGIIIITTLALIIKTMTKVVESNEGKLVEDVMSRRPFGSAIFGVFTTIAVQSSSITTSLLVPLAGSGLLSLRTILSVTVGANIGTTATALLAAMTGNRAALAIAMVHLFFNLLGTLIFFAHPRMREIPISCAEYMAQSVEKTKAIGFGYVGAVFFLIPLSMIYLAS